MGIYEKRIYGTYAGAIALMNYYKLDSEGFIILSVLMCFDTLFGIIKAYVLYGKEDSSWLSSWKLKVGVLSKICIVMLVVLFGIMLGYITKMSQIPQITTTTILGILIVAEFISVLQNVMMIKGGKEIAEWDAISFVLSFLYDKVKDILKVMVSSDKE